MTTTHDVKHINKQLKNIFGCVDDGRVVFRVVWAPTQVELRHGKFNDFTESGLYIRSITETREVPKYGWAGPRYIMERLYLGKHFVELPMSEQGIYESIFTFQDPNKNPLEVTWAACNLIAKASLGTTGVAKPKRTKKQIEDDEREDHARQQKETKEYLDQEESFLSAQLALGSATALRDADPKSLEAKEKVS